ncbi:hypothetical protein [Vibrio coralliilyticus]|uniref:hypothetical protein n=1 Tax=Vibrio coralliilyticus TaxID=190893 RepID=UPI0018223CDE|nr:hypothetical protein [Vibrio coralliilyticus]NUW68972.1 hypothetical protein [Vibrio coralliilyticus]
MNNLSRNDKISFFLLKVYTLLVASFSALEILRLANLYNIAELNKVVTLLVGIPAVLLVLVKFKSNLIKYSFFNALLLILLLFGVLFGFAYGNKSYYVVADAATVSIAISMLFLFSSIDVRKEALNRYLLYSSYLLLLASFLGISFGYIAVYIFGKEVYFSFGSVAMLLPATYFLVFKKRISLFLSILTIVAGGKVGVILSFIVIFFFYQVAKRRISLSRVILASMIAISLVAFVSNSYISSIEQPATGVVGKLKSYSYDTFKNYSADQILNFGGGRLAEVYHSWNKFSSYDGLPLITGAGFGFVYDNYYRGSVLKDVHNVHISFITLTLRHGVLLVIIFYLSLILLFKRLYKSLFIISPSKNYQVLLLFCLGSFVFSFTAFNLFATLFNWIFLGILVREHKRIVTLNIRNGGC